ncbi:MAG: helix-turn-helix transcriptional regulator [Saprospiraceae bacterium]
MELTVKNYQPHKFINNIADQIGIESKLDCLEERITLSGKKGDGKISGYLFSDGIGLVVFDCMLKSDWEIQFVNDAPAPILFNFAIEGELWHTFNNDDIRYQLNPLEGSITACPACSSQTMKIPGNRKVMFVMLLIDREMYLDKIDCIVEKMPDKLADIFTDSTAERPFFHQGNYSISASECMQKINSDKHSGLVRSTFLESKTLELLSRQIKQFKDDLLSPGKQVMLRRYDVDKIKAARDVLTADLQNPPIIEKLAKKVGINQQKLKAGFKVIFDATINQYLTAERMEHASLLLLKGASVKDAALEVGYSNQSHFAKKFKEKYGVLPKEYMKSIKIKLGSIG